MADIILDEVAPLGTERTGNDTDYGKVLNRLFSLGAYQKIGSQTTQRATSSDRIMLSAGKSYKILSRVIQRADSPVLICDWGEEDTRTDLIVDLPSRSEHAFTFRKRLNLKRVVFVDRSPLPEGPALIFLDQPAGTVLTSELSIGAGGYQKKCPLIRCRQSQIELTDCSFAGEGTVLEAEVGCSFVKYHFNLNHGDCRAVKVTSPMCRIDMRHNTIDIGSQLLWMRGDVEAESHIAFNSVQGHRPGIDSLPENGHSIFIQGAVNGLTIERNVFSGADGIDGDTSAKSLDDPLRQRPIHHVKISTPSEKRIRALSIRQNQFRCASDSAILIQGAVEASEISLNGFSGVDGRDKSACLFSGSGAVVSSKFCFNLMSAINNTPSSMFNFSGKTLTDCLVRGNLLSSAGEVANQVGPNSAGNTIRSNLEN